MCILAALACGACTDQGLLYALPWLGYWVLALLAWTLLWGALRPLLLHEHWLRGQHRPILYLGLWLLLSVAVGMLTMGSLMLPFALFLLIWFSRQIRYLVTLRQPAREQPGPLRWDWQVNCGFLILLLVLVPLGYLFPLVDRPTLH